MGAVVGCMAQEVSDAECVQDPPVAPEVTPGPSPPLAGGRWGEGEWKTTPGKRPPSLVLTFPPSLI